MNTRLEKIFRDYLNADFADRICLYLQFPELRNDFFEIERKAGEGEVWFTPDEAVSDSGAILPGKNGKRA